MIPRIYARNGVADSKAFMIWGFSVASRRASVLQIALLIMPIPAQPKLLQHTRCTEDPTRPLVRPPQASRLHARGCTAANLRHKAAPHGHLNVQLFRLRAAEPPRAERIACSAAALTSTPSSDAAALPLADNPAGGLFLTMLPGQLYYAPCLIPMLAAVASALGARYAPAVLAWASHLNVVQVRDPHPAPSADAT